MSDYIRRKALIDTIEKNCYPIRYGRCSKENGMTVTGIMQAINEQPTAFDLESVIEQFEENKQDMVKAIDENMPSGFYAVSAKDLKAMLEDYTKEQIEILKSAANATNGKNGG